MTVLLALAAALNCGPNETCASAQSSPCGYPKKAPPQRPGGQKRKSSGGVLTFCPRGGMCNQLLGFIDAIAVAHKAGVSLVVPPFLLIKHFMLKSRWYTYSNTCYRRKSVLDRHAIPLNALLNESVLGTLGDVVWSSPHIDQQLPSVLYNFSNVSKLTLDDLSSKEECGRAYHALPHGQVGYSGGSVRVSCLRALAARSGRPAVWFQFGKLYGSLSLCGEGVARPRSPDYLSPFIVFHDRILEGAHKVLAALNAPTSPQGELQFACAHLRLGQPAAWDRGGAERFLKTANRTWSLFQSWLPSCISKNTTLLILTDSVPFVKSNAIVGDPTTGCVASGLCHFADALLDRNPLLRPRLLPEEPYVAAVSMTACSEATLGLYLTRASTFSAMIHRLANRVAARNTREAVPSFG